MFEKQSVVQSVHHKGIPFKNVVVCKLSKLER